MSAIDNIPDWIRLPNNENDADQAQRLFHGRGRLYKGLEHITIDWLPPVLLMTLFKPETPQNIRQLLDYLLSVIPHCESVQLQHRYEKLGPVEVLHGKSVNNLQIFEGSNKYHITLGKNRNLGLFLDMKNGRDWLKKNCEGKRVLNLFAYTCGFSVAAIAGGASEVMNVDMSSSALSVGRDNHRLNKQSLRNVKFERLNIFKSFGRLKKQGPFDILVCDPPTFQKRSIEIERDYPKIMRRLNDFMSEDGDLLLCLNSPHLKEDFLIESMQANAPSYRYVKSINPPEVYRDAENKGLKTLIFKRHL